MPTSFSQSAQRFLLPVPAGDKSESSLASRVYAACQDDPNPAVRTDASMATIADKLLYAQHAAAEAHRPSPEALHRGLPPAHRRETVQWVLQAFEVMRFSDRLVFDAVLLLDRFYSQRPQQERPQTAQKRLLAAVCTSLKLGPPLESSYSLKDLVSHLGREAVPFEEVLGAELGLLRALGFQAGSPTAHDLMEAMCERMHRGMQAGIASKSPCGPPAQGSPQEKQANENWDQGRCCALASYLLQLTLFDAEVFYGYQASILAAACVRLALQTLDAPRELWHALVMDLELQLGISDAVPPGCANRDFQCGFDGVTWAVLGLWLRSANELQQAPHVAVLRRKFSQNQRHSVAELSPCAAVRPLDPAPEAPRKGFEPPPRVSDDEFPELGPLLRQIRNHGEFRPDQPSSHVAWGYYAPARFEVVGVGEEPARSPGW